MSFFKRNQDQLKSLKMNSIKLGVAIFIVSGWIFISHGEDTIIGKIYIITGAVIFLTVLVGFVGFLIWEIFGKYIKEIINNEK